MISVGGRLVGLGIRGRRRKMHWYHYLIIWLAVIVVAIAVLRGFGDTLKRQPLDRER